MKKAFLLLVIVLVVVVGALAYRSQQHSENNAASGEAITDGGTNDAAVGARNSKVANPDYRGYVESISSETYRQEPVAIERLVELNNACNGVVAIKPGADVTADVARLQTFCDGYQRGAHGSVDWAKSYTAMLAAKLDKMRADQGEDAVAQELARVLQDAKPQEARDALQYAADNGVVPSSLKVLVDPQVIGTNSQRDQMEALAQIEFCRRGGDCGVNDFATLSACVVLGPCRPGDTLLSIMRRKHTPENFEAAQRMSRALSNG